MSGKRRHRERQEQLKAREQREEQDALKALQEAVARGVGVDRDALAPHGSYGEPDFVERGYYVDVAFVCRACGVDQVWTAAQQKWWYEVARGQVFSTAILCRPCRKVERAKKAEARAEGGRPNPYRGEADLLAFVRSDLGPVLLAAGYEGGAGPAFPLVYTRAGDSLAVSWEPDSQRLVAGTTVGGEAGPRQVATAQFAWGLRSIFDIEARVASFAAAIGRLAVGPGQGGPGPPGSPSNSSGTSDS